MRSPRLLRDHHVQEQTILALQLPRRRRHRRAALPRRVRLRADPPVPTTTPTTILHHPHPPLVLRVRGELEAPRAHGRRGVADVGEVVVRPLVGREDDGAGGVARVGQVDDDDARVCGRGGGGGGGGAEEEEEGGGETGHDDYHDTKEPREGEMVMEGILHFCT